MSNDERSSKPRGMFVIRHSGLFGHSGLVSSFVIAMPDSLASNFRELVSGKRRGVGATLARGALRLAEAPYSLAVRWRTRQYDTGRRPIERVGVPVISVGNLTLGGTGKT